jgi:alanine racemase
MTGMTTGVRATSPQSEIHVDRSAVSENTEAVVRFVAPAKVYAVVKAGAYGHGATQVARAALDAGAHGLCVATTAEAWELTRVVPRTVPILVLGPSLRDDWGAGAAAGLEFVGHSAQEVAYLTEAGIAFHIELNTGLNRWGLTQLPHTMPPNAVGVMTHFAHGHLDPARSARELDTFLAMTAALGCDPIRHAASSGPLLTSRAAHLDAVRCGQLLLGLRPAVGDGIPTLDLRPALTWTSHISHVHKVGKGDRVGYGGRFRADRDTWLGVVPVGYADGFSTALSGSTVLVGADRAEIVGAVSMDYFTVTLPRQVPIGCEVTLVGQHQSIDDHARVAGVGNVELAVGVSRAATRGVFRYADQPRQATTACGAR